MLGEGCVLGFGGGKENGDAQLGERGVPCPGKEKQKIDYYPKQVGLVVLWRLKGGVKGYGSFNARLKEQTQEQ